MKSFQKVTDFTLFKIGLAGFISIVTGSCVELGLAQKRIDEDKRKSFP